MGIDIIGAQNQLLVSQQRPLTSFLVLSSSSYGQKQWLKTERDLSLGITFFLSLKLEESAGSCDQFSRLIRGSSSIFLNHYFDHNNCQIGSQSDFCD